MVDTFSACGRVVYNIINQIQNMYYIRSRLYLDLPTLSLSLSLSRV